MDLRVVPITYLDIHHTAGHEKDTEAVRRYHVDVRGYGDIGYNSVIEPNGTVGKGRDTKWAGAHDPGVVPREAYSMNQTAYAISCIGNFHGPNADVMSEMQFQSLLKESHRVCVLYKIPITKVRRHKAQYATDCPGDKFPWVRYIQELSELLRGGAKVKKVVVFFSSGDYSAALSVANQLGFVAMFCRNGKSTVHPDAMAADQVFNIGGPKLGHSNEVYMSGNNAIDTMEAVVNAYKGGKLV